MSAEDRLALRVGAAMLVAMAIAAAVVMTVDDVSLRRRISVAVHMEHSGGLREGAEVQVAGRVVGEIASIELARPGGAVLHARIEKRFASMCAVNGEWFENSKGVFGERYLEVGPPAGDAAPARAVRDGDVIQGISPPRLDRLAAVSYRNIMAARELARELEPEWSALMAALDDSERLLGEIAPGPRGLFPGFAPQSGLVTEVKESIELWGGTGTSLDDVRALAASTRAVMAKARGELGAVGERLDRLAAEIDRVRASLDPERLGKFERALDDARTLLARVDVGLAAVQDIAAFIDAGQGTIGGFMHDEELRDFAKRLQRIIKRQIWEVVGHPDNRKLQDGP